ncbi:MAG: hypothetical protein ACTHQQ_23845 [Solirubrobacteraceae bacterium]
MRKALALSAVITLTFAAVAVAAGPTIKVNVRPDTPRAQSTLKVSATGPYSESGLPKSLELTAQNGFKSSPKSVSVLCNSKSSKVTSNLPNPCRNASKVGSGKVVANVSGLGQASVPFTLYLGKPRHRSDIASIVLSGTLPIVGTTDNVVGRLFKAGNGSIEMLFKKLPSAPSGITIAVKSVGLRADAVNGKHSLITNPSSCTGGHWTGTFTLTFSAGTVSKHTSIPCSK